MTTSEMLRVYKAAANSKPKQSSIITQPSTKKSPIGILVQIEALGKRLYTKVMWGNK